jgi:hypothetical protein
MNYEIVATNGGERDKNTGLMEVVFYVKHNNKYYMFDSVDGENIEGPIDMKRNASIPLGNWFFVEEFTNEDIAKFPEFIEAIDKAFGSK